MKPEHLKLESTSGAQINMEALYQICPSCFTETKDEKTGELRRTVNFTTLRQLLGDDTVENAPEAYEFNWVGKQEARREVARPINKTLRPVKEDSVDWDNTENLYIEGDNLEALKLLQKSYLGKVKMIYIDPPYNTGNDFVYDDDFATSQRDDDLAAGNVDELGNRFRKNTDTNGRFHSDWCSMIYSRLILARTLLTEDGVIFISIDDNEVENLRKICDEIFGKENLVACLIWKQGRKSMAAQIAVNHEYCLIYNKNRAYSISNSSSDDDDNAYPYWRTKKEGLEEIYSEYDKLKSIYGEDYISIEKGIRKFFKSLDDNHPSKAHSHYKCVDKKGVYFPDNIAQGTGNGGRFEILHPLTGKPCKMPNGGWRFGINKLPSLLKEGRIHFGPDENTVPCLKRYLKETEYEVMPSVLYKDGRGASKRLEQLFGAKGLFPFPKDEEVIKTLISISVSNEDSLILDFFSGSATTAHAVMQLNSEDGGKRKFIMVQLPEKTAEDSEAYKAGYKNICEIGKERIRRAGKKIKEESPLTTQGLDTGFRVFRVDDSNMKEVYYAPKEYNQGNLDLYLDDVKADRTDLDLLFGCMLDWGVQLSLPMKQEKVGDCIIYTVNDGDLVACFSKEITKDVVKAIADKSPLKVIFRDSCFAQDDAKINIYESFKQLLNWSDDEVFRNIKVI
jgi:adenine-specific DNA-methyltransferase